MGYVYVGPEMLRAHRQTDGRRGVEGRASDRPKRLVVTLSQTCMGRLGRHNEHLDLRWLRVDVSEGDVGGSVRMSKKDT
jgi:hypothetical protein